MFLFLNGKNLMIKISEYFAVPISQFQFSSNQKAIKLSKKKRFLGKCHSTISITS